MLRITLDASSWKVAASPASFPEAAGIASFRKIHAAAAEGKLLATLPETVFALEAVKAAWRQRLRGDRSMGRSADVSEQPDGTLKVMHGGALRQPTHPEANPDVARYWRDATATGFKLLRCPRLAMTASSELKSQWFIEASYEIVNRFGDCSRALEAAGCGMSHLEALEARSTRVGPPWHDAIARVSVAEATAIIKAVAEWADGDTVAAHYAYANDYICTSHPGTGGADAILSTHTRATMLAKINIRFVTPEQLAGML